MWLRSRWLSQESNGEAKSDGASAHEPVIAPPKERRPQSYNPRRHLAASAARMGSKPSAPATDEALIVAQDGGASVVGNEELSNIARQNGWRLAWMPAGAPEQAEALGDARALIVVHARGLERATKEYLESVRSSGAVAMPIFVLLSDVSGATACDGEYALSAQQSFAASSADDVLCNTRSGSELGLAVSMALCRHELLLASISRLRARMKGEAETRLAKRLQECEDEHASGLFWQSVDRFFHDFPKMDLGLPTEVEPGTRLGQCVVESVLGQGSFGKVFSATNLHTSEKEALKLIAKASIKRAGQASALHREMTLHGRLSHQHIIGLLEVYHGPVHVVLRMERASGGNLFKAIRASSGALPLERARRLQGQVACAVAYCHERGVAHRDLKPENVALDGPGLDAKLLDFGCCAPTGRPRGEVVGSFPFMAPEVLLATSDRPYEPAAVDVWSSAVLLLEMVCGLFAFSRMLGWDRTTRASPQRAIDIARHFADGGAIVRMLTVHFGRVDLDLEKLLSGMLAIDTGRRWSAKRVERSHWFKPG